MLAPSTALRSIISPTPGSQHEVDGCKIVVTNLARLVAKREISAKGCWSWTEVRPAIARTLVPDSPCSRDVPQGVSKTNGSTDAQALVAAVKGMSWESPRGPITIDAETRDIVQTIYIRRVQMAGGASTMRVSNKLPNNKASNTKIGG
jgi:hypothetical protein